jgi:cyclophilin family peptidyl-prolyl cis-trans isomerase
MKPLTFTALFIAGLASSAFAVDEKKETPAAGTKAPANPVVEIKTSMGTIMLELNKEKAPITVENFLKYVEKKHYDGTVFHRVIDNFMIQGGGFAKEGDKLVEKATMAPIKNEASNGLKNEAGTIAMARTQVPDSATSQFFINVKSNDFLNQNVANAGYAVFGKVTKGMDVVNQIKGVKTGVRPLTSRLPSGELRAQPSQDVPVEDVIIESVSVVSGSAPAAETKPEPKK